MAAKALITLGLLVVVMTILIHDINCGGTGINSIRFQLLYKNYIFFSPQTEGDPCVDVRSGRSRSAVDLEDSICRTDCGDVRKAHGGCYEGLSCCSTKVYY